MIQYLLLELILHFYKYIALIYRNVTYESFDYCRCNIYDIIINIYIYIYIYIITIY